METTDDQICCPKFDPIPWDDKNFEWNDKIFVRGSIFTFFYMPLTFGRTMKKMDQKITEAGASWSEGICLSDYTSKWNMDLWISVDKEVPSLQNQHFTGKFYTKVYEGAFRDTGIWHKDFEKRMVEKGFGQSKIYLWYTTCPKCAKKYGKNYVVMVAKIG